MKLLSDDLNVRIVSILWSGPSNPRRLSRILGVDETVVSRRLKSLERAGLVESRWTRVGNVNVKLHYLKVSGITIRFEPGGLKLTISGGPGGRVQPIEIREHSIPSYSVFVGRKGELGILRRIKHGLVFVAGIAGIGKTALVARHAEESGLPTLWNTLTPITTFFHIMRRAALFFESLGDARLMRALESGVMDPQSLQAIFMGALEELEVLVVFDDYHKCFDETLRSLIRNLASHEELRAKIIVVSREKPDFYLPPSRIIELGELGIEDARRLFEVHGLSPEVADRAYRLLGGHPYMLNSYINSYKSGVRKIPSDIRVVKYYLLVEVLRRLSEDERRVLEIISAFREPTPFKALLFCGVEGRKAKRALSSLESKMLVSRIRRSYMVHELLRDVCYQSVRDVKMLHKCIARFYSTLKTESSFFEMLYHYIMAEEYDEAARAIRKSRLVAPESKAPSLDGYIETLRLIERKTTNELDRGYVLASLAGAYLAKGLLDPALTAYKEALRIAKRYRDAALMAWSYRGQATIEKYMGRYDEALRLARRSARLTGRRRRLNVHLLLISLYYFTGRLNRARNILERLLKSYGHEDMYKALMTGWLGMVYRLYFMFDLSTRLLTEAIKLFSEMGSLHGAAIGYRELGNTLLMALDLEEARGSLERTVSIASQNRYLVVEVGGLLDIAIVDLLLGRVGEAKNEILSARGIIEKFELFKIPEYVGLLRVAESLLNLKMGMLGQARELAWRTIRESKLYSFYRRFESLVLCGGVLRSIGEEGWEDVINTAVDMLSPYVNRDTARNRVIEIVEFIS